MSQVCVHPYSSLLCSCTGQRVLPVVDWDSDEDEPLQNQSLSLPAIQLWDVSMTVPPIDSEHIQTATSTELPSEPLPEA